MLRMPIARNVADVGHAPLANRSRHAEHDLLRASVGFVEGFCLRQSPSLHPLPKGDVYPVRCGSDR